ncbi:hypothetical protein [Rugosimonospora africana]|uniref:hypothetical protein n=1 Tax=Rugosimonospora africana TaxID=556532 RepID=UPI00194513E9|nr:hypothetical protein [Rugosimonospora africana]
MTDIPSALSPIAATAAAILAGINLVVSGRREHGKWAREALVDAFMEYMGASYVAGHACRVAIDIRRGEQDSADIPTLRQQAQVAHDTQRSTMTRLRLLASADVVAAAELLHEHEHRLVSLAFDAPSPPDDDAWAVNYARLWHARDQMIRMARRSMRLPATADIVHGRPGRT